MLWALGLGMVWIAPGVIEYKLSTILRRYAKTWYLGIHFTAGVKWNKPQEFSRYILFDWSDLLNVLNSYCTPDLYVVCIRSACCLHISLSWMHPRSVELFFGMISDAATMISSFFSFSQWPRFVPDLGMVLSDWIGN